MSGGWNAGSFSISVDMSANDAAGIPIISSAFSNQTDEIKAGINNCIAKDGQNTPSADLPMATRKHSNVGKAVAITNYLRAQEFIEQNPVYMSDVETGSVSISCSTAYWPASTTAGMFARIKMGATKPQASASGFQIKINGITTSAVMPDGGAVVPGALVSGHVHDFIHDGTRLRLQNPYVTLKKYTTVIRARTAAGASVTVTPSPVTVTMLAAVDGDILWVGKEEGTGSGNSHQISMELSTANYLVWSAVPSYLFGDATADQWGGFCVASSSDIAQDFKPGRLIVNPSNSQIRMYPSLGNIGSACLFPGFLTAVPRRKI